MDKEWIGVKKANWYGGSNGLRGLGRDACGRSDCVRWRALVHAAVFLLVVPETSGELSDWHLSRMTLLYVFIAV
jgi:hypothetical protein